jgi:hypothetical protein
VIAPFSKSGGVDTAARGLYRLTPEGMDRLAA